MRGTIWSCPRAELMMRDVRRRDMACGESPCCEWRGERVRCVFVGSATAGGAGSYLVRYAMRLLQRRLLAREAWRGRYAGRSEARGHNKKKSRWFESSCQHLWRIILWVVALKLF